MRTSRATVCFFLLIFLLAGGCSKQGKSSGGASAEADESDQTTGGNAGERKASLRFRTEVCVHRNGTGGEAFSMLVPTHWKFTGGITRVLDNPGMPATAWLRAINPSVPEELEAFPNQSATREGRDR